MKADIRNVEHIRICGGKNIVCHWPRQGGLWYWGDDEILLAHAYPGKKRNQRCIYELPVGWKRRCINRDRPDSGGYK